MGGGFVVLLADLDDLGVVQEFWLIRGGPGSVRRSQRAVSGQGNIALGAEVQKLLLDQLGTALHLVGDRLNLEFN